MRIPHPRLARARAHLLDWSYAAAKEAQHLLAPRRVQSYPPGDGAPVLLLPGVYETWQFLVPIADRLSERGHPIHAVPGFGLNRATIPEMSALAAAYLAAHDLRDVVVIAHSKGGLIGKHLMLTEDAGDRVTRLITVNTPFAGSRYATMALRRTLREFAPKASTIAALAAQLEVNSRIVSIFSEEDPVIPGNGELDGAVNIRLPLIGHFRPLSSALVLDTIAELVDDATSEGGGAAPSLRGGE